MNIKLIFILNSIFDDYGNDSDDFYFHSLFKVDIQNHVIVTSLVTIYGVKIRTCSFYFDHYVLWINSTEVKESIFRNSRKEIQDLLIEYYLKIKSRKDKNNADLIFCISLTLFHSVKVV